jgi:hypothetical protein
MQITGPRDFPIVHASPNAVNQQEYGAGNWKAIAANRIALQATGKSVALEEFDPGDFKSFVENKIGGESTAVLAEYSWWPEFAELLRRKYPKIRICVRTHNIEPYQRFLSARKGDWRDYFRPRLWSRSLKALRSDVRCKQLADSLLSISEWDDAHYWRWLPGKARLKYLPYFSPWPYLRPEVQPQPWDRRQRAIVSMGGNFDVSGIANFTNFEVVAAKGEKILGADWSFVLTWWSQWHKQTPQVKPPVVIERSCQEPWDLLCGVRGLAVLTPYGTGLKTTIIDGLAAGCRVIVHPRLFKRLSPQIQELVCVCDPGRDADIAMVAEYLQTPPRNRHINEQLRESAVSCLNSLTAAAESR